MDLYLEDLESYLGQIERLADKIRFFVTRHLDLYSNNRAEGKILLHEAHCLPKTYSEEIAKKERKYFQILSDLLSEFFGSATPRRRVKVMTFSLFGMCNWIYSWYDPKGSVKPQELSEIICDIFFDGVNGIKG